MGRRGSFRVVWGAGLFLAFVLVGCGGGGSDGPGAGSSAADAPAEQRVSGTDEGRAASGAGGGISPGDAPGQVRRTARIQVAGHPVTVEIADTPELRERGLMHRDSLPEDHGMLFVYPESRILSFWMVNTRIPLDIAFIDRNGVIVDLQTMEPRSDELHVSSQEAMYALEMEAGWFEDHEVQVGDQVEL